MRAVALLLLSAIVGCGRAVPEPPAPVTVSPPAPAAAPTRPPPPEVCRCITHCFIQNGELREVNVIYRFALRDTLTRDSLPLSQVAPLTGEYAAVAGWYVQREPITFRGRRYTQGVTGAGDSRAVARRRVPRRGRVRRERGHGLRLRGRLPSGASGL